MGKHLPQLREPSMVYAPANPIEDNFGANADALDFQLIVRVLQRFKFLIVASTLACGFLALIYGFLATPQYTASSTVQIGTYQPILSAARVEDMLRESSKEQNYFETQLKAILSFSVADKVLQDENLRQRIFPKVRPSFFDKLLGKEDSATKGPATDRGSYITPVGLIEGYVGKISVNPIRRTSLVTISATTTDPRLSAEIANAHAKAYIDWGRDSRVEQQSTRFEFLKAQERELQEKVTSLEKEMAEYSEAHSIVALNKDENITVQKLSQLNSLLTQTNERRLEAENLYRETEKSLSAPGPAAVMEDPSLAVLRSRLAELEAEYGNLSAKFTPSYPKMQQLSAQISNLKSSIDGQRKQVVLGLKSKWEALKEKENSLKEELEKQKSMTFELSRSQVQYNILNRELESSRELLQGILKQMKETSLTSQSNASNVSLIDLAVVPKSPSYPKKKFMLLVGLLAGLAGGVGLAFFLSYLDNTIRTPDDLTRSVGLPNLGIVPSFESEQALGGASPLLLTESVDSAQLPMGYDGDVPLPVMYVLEPKSLAAEAYRTIRTGMLLSRAGEPPRTILVSSAQPSEGKTTSAVNLAATLASSGGRVVIVDADLRRPSVHKYFNMDSRVPGLVQVLTGQRPVELAIIPNVIKGVSVIPAGEIPPNPAELLASREMAQIIDKLAAIFQYVIIDSPPVLPVTDSLILSRYVDGVLIVVKGASTPKKIIRDAVERLHSVGAKFIGAILNNVDVTSGDYYYYGAYYRTYYTKNEERDTGTDGA